MTMTKPYAAALIAFAMGALAACGAADVPGVENSRATPPLAAALSTPPTPAVVPAAARLPDFSTLVEQVGPAVVNISTIQAKDSSALPQLPDLPKDHPLYDFLRRFGMPDFNDDTPSQGLGSGFIVSADGFVLTNAHVVDDATEVTVKLTDKREFKARVVGVDKRSDIALLKIDAEGLPTVRIGDADKVKVGAWVLAVGQPFGFENTVTAGIVSAKSRSLPDETLVPFIQTDVAINPGNSGGPLFNLDGEVIGINAQIYSQTGGFMGLSFAIPIDVAMKVKDQLQATGHVSRGKLGVVIQPVTAELAQSFGLERPIGALVSSVESGSAAERAGIVPGDVVLAVNGLEIDANGDLARIIGNLRPGQVVMLRIWRQARTHDIQVTLGELEPVKVAEKQSAPLPANGLGLALRPLAAAEARELDVRNGLMVEHAEGSAARSGLLAGDVILAVNGEPVVSPEQFGTLVAQGGPRALLVQRGQMRLYVPLRSGQTSSLGDERPQGSAPPR